MNLAAFSGVLCGLAMGIIIVIILLKFANRDGKLKTEYDERQELALGKGNKVGLYSLLIMLGIMTIISIAEIQIPARPEAIYSLLIFLSISITCTINIWNGSYFGINNDIRKYGFIFVALAIINIAIVVVAGLHGGLIVDGMLATSSINLWCAIMFAYLGIVFFAKHVFDKKHADEEDE